METALFTFRSSEGFEARGFRIPDVSLIKNSGKPRKIKGCRCFYVYSALMGQFLYFKIIEPTIRCGKPRETKGTAIFTYM